MGFQGGWKLIPPIFVLTWETSPNDLELPQAGKFSARWCDYQLGQILGDRPAHDVKLWLG
jgi:hypothetical protein